MKVPEQQCFEFIIMAHNLDYNPGDVPQVNETVFNEDGDKVWFNGEGWYHYSEYYEGDRPVVRPRIWYEIPKFDNLDLESLSKEELIALILKERGEK